VAVACRIPFNKPTVAGREFEYIRDAILRGKISGDGHYTRLAQDLLRAELGAASVLLTTSCTHALEMAALLLDLHPGDEVIIPSFTFVSTANAFVLRGARPVFADIRPDTLNLDESKVEQLITSRTRAIVVVHYAGVACEMSTILEIAARHGIPVVEDNAHGLFATYRGQPLGTFGCLATQSFHETKNISCGEGGALVLNDARLIERAEILREKGTNRSKFFRGQVDKYTWIDVGSSYVLSDCLAAFLYAQLEQRHEIQAARRRIWMRYATELASWAADSGIGLPHVPQHCEQSYHMFYLLMPSLAARDAFINHLAARGILAVFHYVPLHLAPAGRTHAARPAVCPVAESAAGRIVRLPLYYGLAEQEQDEVIETAKSFRPSASSIIQLSAALEAADPKSVTPIPA
jgi:dTDP-4-amino-4,6-dideoxygalactose transaminase